MSNQTPAVYVPHVKFARLNKRQDLAGYQTEVAAGRFVGMTVRVAEARFLTPAEFDAFADSLLRDDSRLAGKGGCERVQLADVPGACPAEENDGTGWVRVCVLVVAPGRPSLYVDPQGYKYARYVGI